MMTYSVQQTHEYNCVNKHLVNNETLLNIRIVPGMKNDADRGVYFVFMLALLIIIMLVSIRKLFKIYEAFVKYRR